MSRFYPASLALLALAVPSSAQALARTLDKAVKEAGYRLYQPPRENWGPGTVVVGRLRGNQLNVERALCPSLFATVRPTSSSVVLPDYSGTSDTDLSLGLSLLDKIVGAGNAANLKAGYKAPRNVTIKWGPLTEQAYFGSAAYTPTGQAADVDPACLAAVNDLKRRGRLRDVFVIDRALSAESLSYTFKRGNETTPSGGGIGGDLKIAGLLTISANAGYSVRDENVLVINKPLYVAYAKPARISEFLPQGLVSGSRVVVKLERSKRDLVVR